MASPGFYSSMTCCFMGHQDIPRWEKQKILTWIGSLEFPTFNLILQARLIGNLFWVIIISARSWGG